LTTRGIRRQPRFARLATTLTVLLLPKGVRPLWEAAERSVGSRHPPRLPKGVWPLWEAAERSREAGGLPEGPGPFGDPL